jgi:hypothetical protein
MGAAVVSRITPCYRCPLREGCERRAELAKRCAGLGAVSIKFRCDILKAALRIGRRVLIQAPRIVNSVGSIYGDGGPYEERNGSFQVKATITAVYDNHRFRSTVDPDSFGDPDEPEIAEHCCGSDKIRFRKCQPHYRILRFLEEPDMPVCRNSNVQRAGTCDWLRDGDAGGCWCSDDEKNAQALAGMAF